jgi:hypothetical protein
MTPPRDIMKRCLVFMVLLSSCVELFSCKFIKIPLFPPKISPKKECAFNHFNYQNNRIIFLLMTSICILNYMKIVVLIQVALISKLSLYFKILKCNFRANINLPSCEHFSNNIAKYYCILIKYFAPFLQKYVFHKKGRSIFPS